MFLSVPSVLSHGKVPPPVAEETHHGSMHQPSQLHRDAGGPRGSAKVTVLAGDSCHLLRQPLQLGKGSLAGTVPGVGHPSAAKHIHPMPWTLPPPVSLLPLSGDSQCWSGGVGSCFCGYNGGLCLFLGFLLMGCLSQPPGSWG